MEQRLLRKARAFHDDQSQGRSASASARSPLTGEPYAGNRLYGSEGGGAALNAALPTPMPVGHHTAIATYNFQEQLYSSLIVVRDLPQSTTRASDTNGRRAFSWFC